MEDRELTDLLSSKLNIMFKTAASAVKDNPSILPFALKTVNTQRKAASRRKGFQEEGIHVPPFMIMSITNRCNLDCKGCYAKKFQQGAREEMEREMIDDILSQANDLGVSIVMIAGGEPLMRKDILEIMEGFPEIIFPLFTNGTMITDDLVKRLKKARNIVPVLSFEGFEHRTDTRRGSGTFQRLTNASEKLDSGNLFWGTSLTVTRSNFDEIMDPEFIGMASKKGCRLFFFVEYIPVAEGSECEVPTQEQRNRTVPITDELEKRYPGIFIAFPGDEEQFGGCLSSGRGFVHINPAGKLEPCPFAPYSDTDLHDMSLKDALSSRLLKRIRDDHDKLEETSGGCALWRNREWVQGLTKLNSD